MIFENYVKNNKSVNPSQYTTKGNKSMYHISHHEPRVQLPLPYLIIELSKPSISNSRRTEVVHRNRNLSMPTNNNLRYI